MHPSPPDSESGRASAGGLLLIVLVTAALMAALGGVVLRAMERNDAVVSQMVPTTVDSSGDDGATTGGSSGAGPAMEAADAGQCRLNQGSIDSAIATFEVLEGRPPGSIDDLVAAGTLTTAPPGWDIEVHDDGAAAVPSPGGVCDR